MSGGTQQVKLNENLAAASVPLLARATNAGTLPYTPNRGVQFAAFTPTQQAAFSNTDAMANAFGLANSGGNTGMPQAQVSNGVAGYTTGGLFDNAVNQSLTPQMQGLINSFFVDPNTGQHGGQGGAQNAFIDPLTRSRNRTTVAQDLQAPEPTFGTSFFDSRTPPQPNAPLRRPSGLDTSLPIATEGTPAAPVPNPLGALITGGPLGLLFNLFQQATTKG